MEQKRKEIWEKYGIGAGFLWRYGLKLVLEVFKKCRNRCIDCGNKKDLTIHHLDNNGRNMRERGLPANNFIDNLIVLCRPCHGSIHGYQRKGKHKKINHEKETRIL